LIGRGGTPAALVAAPGAQLGVAGAGRSRRNRRLCSCGRDFVSEPPAPPDSLQRRAGRSSRALLCA
jgi:hypothetical protein